MARKPPHNELPFFSFNVYELNRKAAEVVGTSQMEEAAICIIDNPSLACIQTESPVQIYLHPLFNVGWLPIQVMEAVLIHEHIHRVIPPRDVESKLRSHPPEFWEMERKLNPTVSAAWSWMYMEWLGHLKPDKEAERTRIKRGWKKRLHDRRRFFEDYQFAAGLPPLLDQYTTWGQALARVADSPGDQPLL